MKKKLTINRETIRTLTNNEMQDVVGGFAWSEFTNCTLAYNNCPTAGTCPQDTF